MAGAATAILDHEIPGGAEGWTEPASLKVHKSQTSFMGGKKCVYSNHLANYHGYLIHRMLCLTTQTFLAKSYPSVKAISSRKLS